MGWVLLTLYTGVFALVIYWFLHRAPARETPEQSQPSLWEQSVESTIHCVAGDATGILIAAVVTSWLRLPMGVELIVEYVAGFAVGLFLFQALCMKSTFDGSYRRAVRGTFLPETLSMNAIMAGMIPVMIILRSQHMARTSVKENYKQTGKNSLAGVVLEFLLVIVDLVASSSPDGVPLSWWKRYLRFIDSCCFFFVS